MFFHCERIMVSLLPASAYGHSNSMYPTRVWNLWKRIQWHKLGPQKSHQRRGENFGDQPPACAPRRGESLWRRSQWRRPPGLCRPPARAPRAGGQQFHQGLSRRPSTLTRFPILKSKRTKKREPILFRIDTRQLTSTI